MPIRPEMRDKYPANWKDISKAIRARAGDKCETCGRPNGVEVIVYPDGRWHRYYVACGIGDYGIRITKTVLTVAHLDHDPTNNDPANLRALCQRCHLVYDAKEHARNARATRARKAGQGTLKGVE